MSNNIDFIWIFHGAQVKFTSGVFTTIKIAEEWIRKHRLTGMLTLYPVNEGTYDWAIKNGHFTVKKENHEEPLFIQGFSTAIQKHRHYENGEIDPSDTG